MRTIRYGPEEGQEADLWLPAPEARRPPVVCLLHGGFWRMPYGRDQLDAVAGDLVARGWAVWNLEYRRLGAPGGGWPGTFDDVAAGIDRLAALAGEGVELDLDRVAVAGHSAGGQLALWSAARSRPESGPGGPERIQPVDLAGSFVRSEGSGAVAQLLGGSPGERPERYAAASPIERLPLGVPQLILHGTADEALPVESARDYARAAAVAGDDVELVELPRAGHMEFLDPASDAHRAFRRWLEQVVAPPARP
jgi:acetyl esterase/lipase